MSGLVLDEFYAHVDIFLVLRSKTHCVAANHELSCPCNLFELFYDSRAMLLGHLFLIAGLEFVFDVFAFALADVLYDFLDGLVDRGYVVFEIVWFFALVVVFGRNG